MYEHGLSVDLTIYITGRTWEWDLSRCIQTDLSKKVFNSTVVLPIVRLRISSVCLLGSKLET
jgi:hypothetical protein